MCQNVLQKQSNFKIQYSKRPHRDLLKLIFFHINKLVEKRWSWMTNAFILCDLLWNVQKNHAANREGRFKPLASTGPSLQIHKQAPNTCKALSRSRKTTNLLVLQRPEQFWKVCLGIWKEGAVEASGLKLPYLFDPWFFWPFHNNSHNILYESIDNSKLFMITISLTYLFYIDKKRTFVGLWMCESREELLTRSILWWNCIIPICSYAFATIYFHIS